MASRDHLDPLPETIEAADELDPLVTDDDLLEQMVTASAQVRRLIPQCVAMSLTLREQDVTFTLVTADAGTAQLDAAPHLAGRPCMGAPTSGTVIDLSTRQRHALPVFAAAAEQYGVASTLSLPLLDNVAGGAGSVHLYGASPDCFDGHHEELAEILGARAGGTVTDADLSFATLAAARQAPRILREATTVDVAVAVLATTLDIEATHACERLTDAAGRAGVAEVHVARLLIEVLGKGRSIAPS